MPFFFSVMALVCVGGGGEGVGALILLIRLFFLSYQKQTDRQLEESC